MLKSSLGLGRQRGGPLKMLCLGAHADDIEIGCGGTILKFVRSGGTLEVYWYVFGASGKRATEAVESANLFLDGVKKKKIMVKNFRDGFFPYQGGKIKNLFEELKKSFNPDIIFTHYRDDLHQDHRVISRLTWNTFRDHFILEYEVPKYDGDLSSPNLFVPIDEATSAKKVELIMNVFRSQRQKHWFTEDTFLSILRLRAIETGSAGRYAEAFYSRKMLLDL